MLVVFGGLPGVGKTTIARTVADQCNAVYLRIDTIEQSIRSAKVLTADVGPPAIVPPLSSRRAAQSDPSHSHSPMRHVAVEKHAPEEKRWGL